MLRTKIKQMIVILGIMFTGIFMVTNVAYMQTSNPGEDDEDCSIECGSNAVLSCKDDVEDCEADEENSKLTCDDTIYYCP